MSKSKMFQMLAMASMFGGMPGMPQVRFDNSPRPKKLTPEEEEKFRIDAGEKLYDLLQAHNNVFQLKKNHTVFMFEFTGGTIALFGLNRPNAHKHLKKMFRQCGIKPNLTNTETK